MGPNCRLEGLNESLLVLKKILAQACDISASKIAADELLVDCGVEIASSR
jgi:hypothetical protein